jgi:hypothetical protein
LQAKQQPGVEGANNVVRMPLFVEQREEVRKILQAQRESQQNRDGRQKPWSLRIGSAAVMSIE